MGVMEKLSKKTLMDTDDCVVTARGNGVEQSGDGMWGVNGDGQRLGLGWLKHIHCIDAVL